MGARVGFVDVAAVSGVEQRVRQTLSDHSARLRGLSSGPPAVETAALRKHVFGTAAAAREVTDSVLYVAAPSAAGITPLADPSDGPRHPYLTPAVLLPHVAVAAVAEWRLECMAPPPGAAAAAVHSVLLDAVMLRRQLPDEDSCAAALADSDAEAARTEWRRLPRRLYALAREMNALRSARTFTRWRRAAASSRRRRRQHAATEQMASRALRTLVASRYWALVAHACARGALPLSALHRTQRRPALQLLAALVRAGRAVGAVVPRLGLLAAAAPHSAAPL
eukprot:TRINITY_DN19890_c0_g1_i2.p1 TRINITY_DN19890_c0_g1~~TRINITY_DN19890_c0_g1_i2.p1  ORF type:complete len:297 (+),score=89.57 TRINITY_DN19890_c0_g1_i2:54-893(+)